MIFTPEHVHMIVEGCKTQTRRLVKPGEYMWMGIPGAVTGPPPKLNYTEVCRENGSVRFAIEKTYAVQPGRGLPTAKVKDGRVWMYAPRFALADGPSFDFSLEEWHKRSADWHPLRIRITEIRREKLMNISEDDASDEGVICPECGGSGWMLGPASDPWSGPSEHPCDCNLVKEYAKVWDRINKRKGTRWADNPLVWALTFEVAA